MKDSLSEGLTFESTFQVPDHWTVPYLFHESEEFQRMPRVLATGFMVGLIEWACIKAINPHIDWPEEQTVGIRVNLSHSAATPPGMTVTIRGRLQKVQGRHLSFSITASDDFDVISEGIHERFVINAPKFKAKAASKGEQTAAEVKSGE